MNSCEAFSSKFAFCCNLQALKVDILLNKTKMFLQKKVDSDVDVFHCFQVIRDTERRSRYWCDKQIVE